MGNKLPQPFPSYDVALSNLNELEIDHLRSTFRSMSRNRDAVSLAAFMESSPSRNQYLKRKVLPRLFHVMDSKKDNVLDFEEYLCAVALFRAGSTEEKIRVLFMMYEPTKAGVLTREGFRQMLVDAMMAVQEGTVQLSLVEDWIEEQREISGGMADLALQQFAAQDGKLDLTEFVSFVKVEGSVQALLHELPRIFES